MPETFNHKGNGNFSDGFSVDTSITDDIPDAEPERVSFLRNVVDWFEVLVTAIIAVVVIFSLLFRVATIDGSSMQNTLIDGEKVIVSNLNYTPENGDIVIISRNIENSPEKQNVNNRPIIKRVIATGGQTVNIDFETGSVYVDGVMLKENYISTPTKRRGDVAFPLYVPEGYIFVMGDNRMDSLDSRYSVIGFGGLVDTRYVLGHAVFRIFPFSKAGKLD